MRTTPCTTCPPRPNVGPYAWALTVAVWIALLSGGAPTVGGALMLLLGWAVLGLVLQAHARDVIDADPLLWLLLALCGVAVAVVGALLA